MEKSDPAETRDWAALPPDILCEIFHRTRHADILGGAGLACTSWRRVAADDPTLWRRIDVDFEEDEKEHVNGPLYLARLAMGRAAVDRSAGLCESFRGPADRYLLAYLAARAPSLKRLHVTSIWCLPESFEDRVIAKLPMLEELVLCGGVLLRSTLRALLKHCPRLQMLHAGADYCYTDAPVVYDLLQRCESKIKDLDLPGTVCALCHSWSCHFESRLQTKGGGVAKSNSLCPRIF